MPFSSSKDDAKIRLSDRNHQQPSILEARENFEMPRTSKSKRIGS